MPFLTLTRQTVDMEGSANKHVWIGAAVGTIPRVVYLGAIMDRKFTVLCNIICR